MYTKTFSSLAISMLLTIPASAAVYDFAEGQFFYNILDENAATVEVTFEDTPNPFFIPSYTGDMEIPSHVTHGGKTYTVTAIGEQAFYGCDQLTGITLPSTIKSIGRIAFSMDMSLSSINLPEGLESIGNSAFFFCIKIPYFHIPSSVELIDDNVFFECQSVSEYRVADGNKSYASFDGALYDKSLKNLLWVPAKKTSIELAPTTENIRTNSFSTCRELEHVSLPKSLKVIGKSAFTGCIALKDLNIPSGVDSIGRYAFVGCYSLGEINVEDGNKNYSSIDGVLYSKDQTSLLRFPCAKPDVEIPQTVVTIGEMAFSDCSKIDEVTFPPSIRKVEDYGFNVTSLRTLNLNEGLEVLGESAFGSNMYLTSLYIPASVRKVGNSAFSSCISLEEVTGGEGLTEITESMFSSCTSLYSFTVPYGVTSIADNAFYECRSLQYFEFNDNLKRLGNSAFFNCSTLSNITLPNIEIIEPYTFYKCESLNAIEIPATVTSIGSSAFAETGLERVVIGENIADIAARAFSTPSIVEIKSLAVTPPKAVSNTFNSATFKNATLLVPDGCAETYRDAQVWSKFVDIKDSNLSSIENIISLNVDTIDIYSISGVILAHKVTKDHLKLLQPGVYIISNGKTIQKISL